MENLGRKDGFYMITRQGMRTLMLLLSVIILSAPGCGLIHRERTPEEVFSMALSGIAGKEKLDFVGEAGLRRESSGLFENQFKFEGKLENHDQLTLQTRLPGAVTAAGSSKVNGMDAASANLTTQPSGFSASFQRKRDNGRH